MTESGGHSDEAAAVDGAVAGSGNGAVNGSVDEAAGGSRPERVASAPDTWPPPRFTSRACVLGGLEMMLGMGILAVGFAAVDGPSVNVPSVFITIVAVVGCSLIAHASFVVLRAVAPPKYVLADGTIRCTRCGYPQLGQTWQDRTESVRCVECGANPRRVPPVTLGSIAVDILHVGIVLGLLAVLAASLGSGLWVLIAAFGF